METRPVWCQSLLQSCRYVPDTLTFVKVLDDSAKNTAFQRAQAWKKYKSTVLLAKLVILLKMLAALLLYVKF
jgi:hypothetical protein